MIYKILFLRCRDYLAIKAIVQVGRNIYKLFLIESR